MKFHEVDVRGKFWVQKINDKDTEQHHGNIDKGRVFVSQDDNTFYYGASATWVKATGSYDVFNIGSKVLMGKFPLPDGWSVDSSFNDMTAMTTSAGSATGDISGSWTITTVSTGGAHDHFGGLTGPPNRFLTAGKSEELIDAGGGDDHRHTILVDGIHTHTFDGTWRPKYSKWMMATYSG